MLGPGDVWDPELPEEGSDADRTLRNRVTQAAAVGEGAPDPDSRIREDVIEEGPAMLLRSDK